MTDTVTARKGIILAGGAGSRLHPITASISKQIVPVYDKPMIYYPLSTLMLAGIREYLIITTPRDVESFRGLLGDGTQWGLSFRYATQPRPEGIAQAFLIGADFLAGAPSALILGDNIFFGHSVSEALQRAARGPVGATVFGYRVQDPERYGVVKFDAVGRVVDLVEQAPKPPSNIAVTGVYFYDDQVVEIARALRPSARGELEITDLNRVYLQRTQLMVEMLGRGTAWLDTGTFTALIDAGNFVRIIEERQGLKIACVEEVAYRMGYIDAAQVERLAGPLSSSGYGRYLLHLLEEDAPV